MINFFFRIKHWQLFLAIVLFIVLAYLYMLFSILERLDLNRFEEESMNRIVLFGMLISFISFLIIMGWKWFVGMGLYNRIPEGLKMKKGWFRRSMLYSVLYMAFTIYFYFQLINREYNEDDLVYVYLPLTIVYFISTFYSYFFIAKNLKLAELKKPVTGADYLADFFLIWLFLIGVWVIQPRINKIDKNLNHDFLGELH